MDKYYYNGELLYLLPVEVFETYPYCVILKHTATDDTVTYHAIFTTKSMYVNEQLFTICSNGSSKYLIYKTDINGEWEEDIGGTSSNDVVFVYDARYVFIWTNTTLPKNASNSGIEYFKSSEPILGTEEFAILVEEMVKLANEARRIMGYANSTPMTLAAMQKIFTEVIWAGTISFEDAVKLFNITGNKITLLPVNDKVATSQQIPVPTAMAENVGLFSISSNSMTLRTVTDVVGTDRDFDSYIINVADSANYTYDEDYVDTSNGFSLNSTYTYTSEEQEIDRGSLASVTIQTDDKVSIEYAEVIISE